MNWIRVFYFDTSAIVKYYVKEKGSDVVQRIVGGSIGKSRNVSVTSQTTLYEAPKVLKKKWKLPQGHVQKIDEKSYRQKLFVFRRSAEQVFRPIDFKRQIRKKPYSYRKIMQRHKIQECDARHVVCVLNYLANLQGPSRPIIVSSDKKHILGVFGKEGYQVFDPEKQTIRYLEKMLGCNFD